MKQIAEELLYAYEPKNEWLIHDSHFHGVGHMARVFILQELICTVLASEGLGVNREATRWAAATHDVGRVDDGQDLEHGQRSAAWAHENIRDRMTPETLDIVTYIVHWHVPPDYEAPVMTTELKVLKDADALDRVRLGDLNPSFLRTEAAKSLIDLAQQLHDASRRDVAANGKETFADVVSAAKRLHLLASS